MTFKNKTKSKSQLKIKKKPEFCKKKFKESKIGMIFFIQTILNYEQIKWGGNPALDVLEINK